MLPVKIEHLYYFLFILLVFLLFFLFYIFKFLDLIKKSKKLILPFEYKKLKKVILLDLLFVFGLFLLSSYFAGIKVKTDKTEGVVYMILLDTSGSMNANDIKPSRIEAAKEITEKFIEENKGLFGVITFNNYPQLLVYPTSNKEEIIEKIKKISANGGTDMGDALAMAYSILNNFPNYKKVIILLSDGKPTVGPDPLKIAEKNKDKAQIFTIAIGKDNVVLGYDVFGNPLTAEVDRELLKKLAQITNGKYFEAYKSEDLYNIYKYISQTTQQYYYKEVKSEIVVFSLVVFLIWFVLKILVPLKY